MENRLRVEYTQHHTGTAVLTIDNTLNAIFKIYPEYYKLTNDEKLKVIKYLNNWAENQAIEILNEINKEL